MATVTTAVDRDYDPRMSKPITEITDHRDWIAGLPIAICTVVIPKRPVCPGLAVREDPRLRPALGRLSGADRCVGVTAST